MSPLSLASLIFQRVFALPLGLRSLDAFINGLANCVPIPVYERDHHWLAPTFAVLMTERNVPASPSRSVNSSTPSWPRALLSDQNPPLPAVYTPAPSFRPASDCNNFCRDLLRTTRRCHPRSLMQTQPVRTSGAAHRTLAPFRSSPVQADQQVQLHLQSVAALQ